MRGGGVGKGRVRFGGEPVGVDEDGPSCLSSSSESRLRFGELGLCGSFDGMSSVCAESSSWLELSLDN